MNLHKCVDCQGDLEMGYLLDPSFGRVLSQRYAKVNIAETDHYGKFTFRSFPKSDFRDLRRVITYRCLKCNKLYHYAEDFVEIPNLKKFIARQSRVGLLVFIGMLVMYAAVILFFIIRARVNATIL